MNTGTRLAVRLGAMALGVIIAIAYPSVKRAYHGMVSPCAKVWTAEDLQSLTGKTWERESLYHGTYFCDARFGAPGAVGFDAWVNIDRDLGSSSRADEWLKDLGDRRPVPDLFDATIGTDEKYHRRTVVMRRPHGALKLEVDARGVTEEQLVKAAILVAKDRLPVVDKFLNAD
jgi:hypothetical protein